MITMEFEEMKKIWDTQNERHLYAIDEEALHRSIRAKRERGGRLSNINDFGLMAVALTTAVLVLVIGERTLNDYLVSVILLGIAGYVLRGRIRRKREQNKFDRSMLGELDQAIASVKYEIRRSKTFIWWFLVPVAVPMFANMIWSGATFWKWVVMPAACILSILVVRWELNRKFLPRKKRLELLREKLTEKSDEPHPA